jgi:type II secretory pathway predicted ATPase ExeA
MHYFSLVREFDQAGYFETAHHQFLLKEIAAAIKKGRIIVLAGIVGCGKTKILLQLQQALTQENAVLVARSLAVDKKRVTLNVLMLALNYALTTDETAASLPKQRVSSLFLKGFSQKGGFHKKSFKINLLFCLTLLQEVPFA